jgi:hypothetical protein
MTVEPVHPDGRGTNAAAESPHRGRACVPRSRGIVLPRSRTHFRIQGRDGAHAEGVSGASGTTSRRATDAPSAPRIKIP